MGFAFPILLSLSGLFGLQANCGSCARWWSSEWKQASSGWKQVLRLALGDRYRKFYRTLNNAKKTFIQYSIQKNFNTIHSKFYSFKIQPKYSFKNLFIQSFAHSKNYSFKFSSKYSFKILFIQNPAKIFIQKFIHSKFSPFKKLFI